MILINLQILISLFKLRILNRELERIRVIKTNQNNHRKHAKRSNNRVSVPTSVHDDVRNDKRQTDYNRIIVDTPLK